MILFVVLSLIGVTLVLPLIFFLYIKHRQSRPYWTTRGVPQLTPSVQGTLRERLKAPFHEADFSLYRQMTSKSLTVAGIIELGNPALFITDPELIKAIMVKDFDHFVNRPNLDVGEGDPYFRKMLFNAEGSEWKGLRVTMTPAFTSSKIRRMFSYFTESASLMVKYWEDALKVQSSSPGLVVNVQDAHGKFTLNVIAATAFGFDSLAFSDQNSRFLRMSHRILDALTGGVLTVMKFLLLIFFPNVFNFFRLSVLDSQAISFFVDLTTRTIAERERNEQSRREDFLQLMIDSKNGRLLAEDVDGEMSNEVDDQRSKKLTNELILAQCILFFNAGFDTVQALLDFGLYELALNPTVQETLFQELNEAVAGSKKLTWDVISNCVYLDMVVAETLRKYPPAFRLVRKCTKQYTLPNSDFIVEKGTGIVIPVMPMHYNPEIYPEPDRFIPERFSAANKANRHPAHYMPFGIGQRACIANRFALLEGKVAIALGVLNFRFEPAAETDIPIRFLRSVSGLKPAGGIWLRITKRNIENSI